MTTSPAEHPDLDAVVASLRELKDAVTQNTADLAIQFQRTAQMQADLDMLRIAFEKRSSRKKKSTSDRPAVVADQLPDQPSDT